MTALPTVGDINYPSVEEIRDGALRTIKLGLARVGITVNVLPGSDPFVRAEAWARRAVIAFANNRIRYEDLSPLTTKGDSLVAVAAIFGVTKRPASKSTGFLKIKCVGTVTIPTGYRCTAGNGQQYDPVTAATLATNGKIEVMSVLTGKATAQTAGVQVTWNKTSIGALNVIATVDVGGLDGGVDEDDEETLRRRLLDKLANPAGGGNAAQVRQLSEEATAAVSRAYVYMAVRGPATYDVAVVGADGDRTLSNATVGLVAANLATMPAHADGNVTSVIAEPVNILLLGTLPLPTTAGGTGGGWADGSPWPNNSTALAVGTNDGKVTAYTAPTATVRVTPTPVVGNRIGIWDGTAQVVYEYTIIFVGGAPGAWTIRVQGLDGSTGFKTTPLNSYVSAGATNLTLYATKFLALMLALGPGEKSTSIDVLPRGQRQPVVSGDDPRDVDNRMLGLLMAAYPELEVSYGFRLETTGVSDQFSPSVPAAAVSPPRVLTLKNFVLWKAA